MSTPAEGMLILLLLGAKATDDEAIAAIIRACTWARRRHRWVDCVVLNDVIVFIFTSSCFRTKESQPGVEEVFRNRLSQSDKASQWVFRFLNKPANLTCMPERWYLFSATLYIRAQSDELTALREHYRMTHELQMDDDCLSVN